MPLGALKSGVWSFFFDTLLLYISPNIILRLPFVFNNIEYMWRLRQEQKHTEKSFLNLVELNYIWILISLFRLIHHQTDFRLELNQQLKSVNNNRNLVKSKQIAKIFFRCVGCPRTVSYIRFHVQASKIDSSVSTRDGKTATDFSRDFSLSASCVPE